MIFNVPDELTCKVHDDKVKFKINDISSNWINSDDPFIQRIDSDNINPFFIEKHLAKEIAIKNALDEGWALLDNEKYSRAVDKFDEVLYYDSNYSQALMGKSRALFHQKHFVKSLRYYKRAVKSDNYLKDIEYYKLLIKESNMERSNFPKIKLNIYAGDEYFSKGDFQKAVESYDKALVNPSKFRDKILSKLLNKKATALVKLNRFDESRDCFSKSGNNDYAYFGQGFCEYKMGLEINDNFKQLLDIDKEYQLKQAQILMELGFFTQSLKICDWLMDNHFMVDEFYMDLLSCKVDAMKRAGHGLQ